jgi:hypothetical protein
MPGRDFSIDSVSVIEKWTTLKAETPASSPPRPGCSGGHVQVDSLSPARIYPFHYQSLGRNPVSCKISNINFLEFHTDKIYGDFLNWSFRGVKEKAFQKKEKPWKKN